MRFQFFFFLFFLLFKLEGFSQCLSPTTLFTTNLNYYNAETNWNQTLGTHHYKIRYKIIGASSWSYKNNIDSSLNKKLLTNLTPLSSYIWEIKAYCDSTNTNASGWSETDTFTTNTSACPNTNNIYTTNINFNNATANWDTVYGANRYKLRYRALGVTLWSNIGPIYHPEDSVSIPLLQQNTAYEWQILTYHDTTSLQGSLWSISDTFTSASFIPSTFNPIVINSLSSLQCNTHSELSLRITQTPNEPDIESSVITSDGGYFDINSINSGDSVGFVVMTTATQTSSGVLRGGVIANQNYAIINYYSDTGSLIGFFTIENLTSGIKVSSTTPNDGNNYTSGYLSEIHFTNLFVTPPNAGPLYFFSDIESELNDQIYNTDTSQIWCNPTVTIEGNLNKEIVAIYDFLGRKLNSRKTPLILIQYSDGTFERKRYFYR